MKAILISIKPKYVANILNGKKTLEIRKTLPKCDLPIDVYIYCTKDKKKLSSNSFKYYIAEHYEDYMGSFNGKVVAKFTLNKVGQVRKNEEWLFHSLESMYQFEKASCLKDIEIDEYAKDSPNIYAWHIEKLVPFDKPMELKEFYKVGYEEEWHNLLECAEKYKGVFGGKDFDQIDHKYRLACAPQSWCYIEV